MPVRTCSSVGPTVAALAGNLGAVVRAMALTMAFGVGMTGVGLTGVGVTGFAATFASTAHAQFDDEFDSEFDDEAGSDGAVAPEEQPPFREFDSEFDFGEEPNPAIDSARANDAAPADDSARANGAAAGAPNGRVASEDADRDSPDVEKSDPSDDHSEWGTDSDARRAAAMVTLAGASGGFRLVDARPGARGTWRLQLALGFFKKDGFLFEGDDHDTISPVLSAAWSPADLVELYVGVHSQAAFNRADFPPLLIVLGDLTAGVKVGANVSDTFSIGGDVRLEMPTGTGLGVGFDGMGIGLRALATGDLRARPDPLPLIVRGALGYTFDRSAGLIEHIENRRYDALPAPVDRGDETRHLINRVERFGLVVNPHRFPAPGARPRSAGGPPQGGGVGAVLGVPLGYSGQPPRVRVPLRALGRGSQRARRDR